MKSALCNGAAFEPFQRLVTGPLAIEDLPEAERFVRAVVLHDDVRMLPERIRMEVGGTGDVAIVPEIVKVEGFEILGHYQDPSYADGDETDGPLSAGLQREDSEDSLWKNKYRFDPRELAIAIAIKRIVEGGSAVVRDSEFEIVVMDGTGREQPKLLRSKAAWEERFARAEAYPEELFRQLDESWQRLAKKLAQGGFDLRIPPVLGIVMSRSARRDAIPAVLLDLRNEWAMAREKLWQRVDSLRELHTVKEAEDTLRELEAASKLFSREPSDYDTQPMRVFWDISAAAAVVASTGGAAGAGIGGAAARSLPKMLQDIGPALFGRGAFDLAKRVRREVSKVDPDVLRRFLSPSEQQAFGIK